MRFDQLNSSVLKIQAASKLLIVANIDANIHDIKKQLDIMNVELNNIKDGLSNTDRTVYFLAR